MKTSALAQISDGGVQIIDRDRIDGSWFVVEALGDAPATLRETTAMLRAAGYAPTGRWADNGEFTYRPIA